MAGRSFSCGDCGKDFSLPDAVLAKYPNWSPRQCMDCRGNTPAARKAAGTSAPAKAGGAGLRNGHAAPGADPQTGVFTDGSCQGNPGPGGWGAVWVEDGEIIAEKRGFDPSTTNNRMELTAIIAGLEMLPEDEAITIYSDSQLVVNTLTKWAEGWAKRGWVRREGPVANVELVKRAYELLLARPNVQVAWIPAHSGFKWNEYADALSVAHVDGVVPQP